MTQEGARASASQLAPDSRFQAARAVLADAVAARAFPGCAFVVLANNAVLLHDALGRFTYEDDAPVVTASTVFDIASITKVFSTTAIAMLLYQQGRLDLETPLGDLLPGFVVGRDSTQRARLVTLRHLLAHNSGLPGYVELFRTVSTPQALLRACMALPLETEPGTRVEYSDMGFILLGKALEVLAGAPLDSLFATMIAQPLGLTHARFTPPAEMRSAIPPSEVDTWFRHRRIQGEVQDEHAWLLDGVAGHAGLFSNIDDLLRLAQEMLRAVQSAPAATASLFTRETVLAFAQRQSPAGSSRALGWDTPSADSSAGRLFSQRSIGHLGYSGCSLWIDLEAAVAVVLLTNRTWPDRQNQAIRTVRPAFHDAVRIALTSGY